MFKWLKKKPEAKDSQMERMEKAIHEKHEMSRKSLERLKQIRVERRAEVLPISGPERREARV